MQVTSGTNLVWTHLQFPSEKAKYVEKCRIKSSMWGLYEPHTPVKCQLKALIFGILENNILMYYQVLGGRQIEGCGA